ncbi:MAG: S49 family peptidase [Gemmatimonadales bacterium]|nr:S49 family peptidase [Gemmatimonadales bacterium]
MTEDGLRRMLLRATGPRPKKRQAISRVAPNHLSGTRDATIRDGIATLPIVGPSFRYDDWLLEYYGWPSYESLARDFAFLLTSPEVRAIVLSINSPGGEVDGLHELSRLIFAGRGQKPIHAHISGEGCSAAYYLASTADRIVATADSIVGCLGTRFTAYDDTEFLRQLGFERIEIVSTQTPKKDVDLTTAEGQAAVQVVCDRLADVFLNDVAHYRGVTREIVLADYGQGGVFVGEAALKPGLIDGIMTSEELHAELVALLGGGQASATRSAASPIADVPLTAEAPGLEAGEAATEIVLEGAAAAAAATDVTASAPVYFCAGCGNRQKESGACAGCGAETSEAAPEPAAANTDGAEPATAIEVDPEPAAAVVTMVGASVVDVAAEQDRLRLEAVNAERARLLGIDALARPGYADVIAACKADPTCTPAMAALKLAQAKASKYRTHLDALVADVHADPAPPAAAAPTLAEVPSAASGLLATYHRMAQERAAARRSR